MFVTNFQNFINSETGRILLSIILGLGLESLFRKSCESRKCLVFNAVPLKDVKDKIFSFGEQCYKFEMQANTCDNDTKKVEYA